MSGIRGISGANRLYLDALHRGAKGPFSVREAAVFVGLPRARARRLLAYLAATGWLSRIRRDAYTTVPLGATVPSEWREDHWLIATKAFAPCYIGGWSACEHWSLTEQIFRGIVVVTTRKVRHRRPTIQGTQFLVKVTTSDRFFGTARAWRDKVAVMVSDPARTLLDLLSDPALGGGFRHVADVARNWFAGEHKNVSKLTQYADRLGNRTVYKRLGYLIEALGIEDAEGLASECSKKISQGISLLDPSAKPAGTIVTRWNLKVNVDLTESEQP